MKVKRRPLLTEGPVGPILFRLTVPMIFGTLSMVMFNLVDAYFVGKLGTDELAALSFTFPVMLVISSFAMGLGLGLSVVVSQAFGAGRRHNVQRLTTDGLLLGIVIAALMVVLGLAAMKPVLGLLGAHGIVADMAEVYLRIWFVALVFVVVPVLGNNALRAGGDTLSPSLIMIFAVMINIVLDPVLIFGWGPFPRLEIAGAALATVISRGITLFLSLGVLWLKDRMVTFERPSLRGMLASWKQILVVAVPASLARVMMPLSIAIITGMVAYWGDAAVAALGVAMRIEFFAISVVASLSVVFGPFVGQNRGAGQFGRIRLGLKQCAGFSQIWSLFLYALLFLFARPIALLFDDNPEVVGTIVLYLRIVPLGHGFLGLLMIAVQALNVFERPLPAAAIQFVQVFLLYIPLAWILSRIFGLPGVFAGVLTGDILIGIFAYYYFRHVLKEETTMAKSM